MYNNSPRPKRLTQPSIGSAPFSVPEGWGWQLRRQGSGPVRLWGRSLRMTRRPLWPPQVFLPSWRVAERKAEVHGGLTITFCALARASCCVFVNKSAQVFIYALLIADYPWKSTRPALAPFAPGPAGLRRWSWCASPVKHCQLREAGCGTRHGRTGASFDEGSTRTSLEGVFSGWVGKVSSPCTEKDWR